ncbi:Hypothetical predicted protein [Paramuricea clavata]|uniref:Uncharacterized protein n=1 Tax=Paramuricea clavata TaxID=317549 RepID=A0A6S7KD99_PARCT|nr:Hypothetical predicted protein [Paramuricea clavata]
MSHDIDIILNYEQQKKAKKKRKRKRKSKQNTSSEECGEDATGAEKCETNGSSIDEAIQDKKPSDKSDQTLLTKASTNTASGNHRAGFDAFMTGFSMATYYHRFKTQDAATFAEGIPDFINKLNLSGKDIPLKIEKSQYCKTSANHNETWKKILPAELSDTMTLHHATTTRLTDNLTPSDRPSFHAEPSDAVLHDTATMPPNNLTSSDSPV